MTSKIGNKNMSSSSIPSISVNTPILATQSVQPVQKASDANGNNITLNMHTKLTDNMGRGNVILANLVDIQGDNNNITINQYNDITINIQQGMTQMTTAGGITPNLNPDGSVSFTNADGTSSTIQEYIKELLNQLLTDMQKPKVVAGAKAYNQAGELQIPTDMPSTTTSV